MPLSRTVAALQAPATRRLLRQSVQSRPLQPAWSRDLPRVISWHHHHSLMPITRQSRVGRHRWPVGAHQACPSRHRRVVAAYCPPHRQVVLMFHQRPLLRQALLHTRHRHRRKRQAVLWNHSHHIHHRQISRAGPWNYLSRAHRWHNPQAAPRSRLLQVSRRRKSRAAS